MNRSFDITDMVGISDFGTNTSIYNNITILLLIFILIVVLNIRKKITRLDYSIQVYFIYTCGLFIRRSFGAYLRDIIIITCTLILVSFIDKIRKDSIIKKN